MSISVVSAVDYSTDVTQEMGFNDLDAVSYSNDLNEVMGDRGSGSFTDLQTIIDNAPAGSTINLDKNYVYNNATDSSPIKINKRISINGNNFTLNGNNQSGILEINAYKLSNVVLDNINFINGYLKGSSGAAIRSLSNDIEIKNCYFENNTAKNYGGAIYLGWDRGIISNCLFVNNTADSGGAIYISSNGFTIKNSTFRKNNGNRGGSVYIYSKDVILEDSTFNDNNATYGGAIFVYTSNVTISNSSFENNNATYGVIEWQGDNGTLLNSSLNNNSAKYYGSAVYWEGNNGEIQNSYFNKNKANFAAALFVMGDSVVVRNDTFSDNSAYNAGAIVFGSNNILVDDCLFIRNSAIKYGGGAIDDFGMDLKNNTISNSVFKKNSAMIYGGAVSVSNATIINSLFEDNSAIFGGAVYVINSTVINSTFRNNSANKEGNSIYAINNVTLNNCSIDSSDVVSNLLNERLETIKNYNYTYYTVTGGFYGLCTERYFGNALDGIRDDSLKLLRNSISGEYVGEYLKILIYTLVNKEEDLNHTGLNYAVWLFSDGEFRNSNNTLVKKVLELYDSGLRIPNINASKRLNNGTIIFYDFSSLITPSIWQNLILFKFRHANITENLTKETLNKTIIINNTVEFKITLTNTGNESIKNAFIQDNDYSNGLIYQGWKPITGNWTYNNMKWILNNPLKAGESVSIIITFKALKNGTLINNATSGFDNITLSNSTNTTLIKDPHIKVIKLTNNPIVIVGNLVSFTIKVINTGDCNLNNVFVEESSYDGLIYDSFIGNNWTKSGNKFIYNKILGVGKEASFTVNFKTIKSGNFTNVVVVGSNETPNSTTNNTTQSVSPKLSVIKISNTKIVKVGQKCSFTIVVRNTGDYRLTKVFVIEKSYKGLTYDSFKGSNWIKIGNKFIYKKTLEVGESANFTIFFKTNKVGNFTNVIMAGSNETPNSTVNNTTKVINKSQSDEESNKTPEKQDIVKETKIEKATGNPILMLLMVLILIPLLKRKY